VSALSSRLVLNVGQTCAATASATSDSHLALPPPRIVLCASNYLPLPAKVSCARTLPVQFSQIFFSL